MVEDRENAAPPGRTPRADDLETRIAAIESRLDHIDAKLKTLSEDFSYRQSLSIKKQQQLLADLKREQDSLRKQTGSATADDYEAGQPVRILLGILSVMFVLWLMTL